MTTTTTTPKGWRSNSYVETVTDKRAHSASLYLNDDGAYLLFVCPGSNVLEITLWGAEVPTDSALDKYRRWEVEYRVGDEVRVEVWRFNRQVGRYLLAVPTDMRRDVIDLFRNRESDDFAVASGVPGMPSRYAVYDVGGFDAKVEPVLEACGW